jgi:hypothetical protein
MGDWRSLKIFLEMLRLVVRRGPLSATELVLPLSSARANKNGQAKSLQQVAVAFGHCESSFEKVIVWSAWSAVIHLELQVGRS